VFAVDAAHWRVGAERSASVVPEWARVAGGYFEWTEPLDLALDEYASLWVRGVLPDASRMLRVQLEVTTPDGKRAELEPFIPYLGDDRSHAYTYDLRLLELPRGCRLSAMRIRRAEGGQERAGLEDFRLLPARPRLYPIRSPVTAGPP
jgi:hypothetical protein